MVRARTPAVIADGGAELHPCRDRDHASSTATTARSSSTARSTRPRRSSAASPSSTSPTWTPRSRWPRPGRTLEFPGVAVEIRPIVEDYSAVRVTSPAATARRTASSRATLREEAGPLVARLPASSATSTSPRRRCRTRSSRRSRRWRRDGTPDNPAPGSRSPRGATRSTGCAAGSARSGRWPGRAAGRRAGRAGVRHRRPAAAAVRLLPPGARRRGPARADPARGRRPDHPADRPGVPGQRGDAGPADRPGQAQDRRRRHPADRARRRPAGRAAGRRADGGLR